MAVVCLVLLIAVASLSSGSDDAWYSLTEQIRELRGRGEYEEAIVTAGQLVDAVGQGTEAWDTALWVEDARQLLETVRSAAGLPPERRRILARADSLEAAVWRLGRQERTEEAIAASEKALALYQDVLGPDHPELASMLDSQANRKASLGDLSGAERHHLAAIDVARRARRGPASYHVGLLLNSYALFLVDSLDQTAKAEAVYREALKLVGASVRLDNPVGAALSRSLSNLLIARDEHLEASRLLDVAASVWRQSDEQYAPYFLFETLHLLSVAQYKLHELRLSEASVREAEFLARHLYGAGSREEIRMLIALANIQSVAGKLDEAEARLRTALAMLRGSAADRDADTAAVLDALARILAASGDFGKAEPLFRESLAIRGNSSQGSDLDVAKSLRNLALLLHTQGDFLGAEELLRESLSIRRSRGEADEAVAADLIGLGIVVGKRGDYPQAERLIREALEISRGLGTIETVKCLQSLAGMRWFQGDYEGTELLLEEALETGRMLKGETWSGDVEMRSGVVALRVVLGEYGEAEGLVRELVSDLRSSPARERELAESLRGFGGLLGIRGEYAKAESVLVEAAEVYERARVHSGRGYVRATFWEGSPYDRLAGVRAELGNAEQAWNAAEKGLGRTLADLLLSSKTQVVGQLEAAREESLRTAIARLEQQVEVYEEAALADTTATVRDRVKSARSELLLTEAAWASLQESIWDRQPVAGRAPVGLMAFQSALREDCALIGWIETGLGPRSSEPWAYVIRHSGPVHWFRLSALSASPAEPSATEGPRQFRDDLATCRSALHGVRRDARDLWSRWFESIAPALDGVECLIVVPSAGLVGVPVETFVDDEGAFLGDRYAVSYAPSATTLAWLSGEGRRSSTHAAATGLVLGDPPFTVEHLDGEAGEAAQLLLVSGEVPATRDIMRSAIGGNDLALASLPRLHGTRDEVRGVASMMPRCEVLLGVGASEQRLVEFIESGALRRFDVIHLATHALIDNESPEKSALVLSQVDLPDALQAAVEGARIYDGLVTAKEIAREWDLNADLVTLSACETGLGREAAGEGYIGLSHAFFQAGARSVLVSLWKVEDRATSLLMRRFYENWLGKYEDERNGLFRERMTKARALREAKQWLQTYSDARGARPFEHPYFWSAFILIGDST